MTTFFSFGGGVQSTAIALLLIYKPEKLTDLGLDLPDLILFADTGAEPPQTYDHVKNVFLLLQSAGYQTQVAKKLEKDGNFLGIDGNISNLSQVCWFTRSGNGVGLLKRQCTQDFKITPVQRAMREYLGYQKGQRVKGKHILWLGISVEEARRMRINSDKWLINTYPLIQLGWNRVDCAIYNAYCLGYQVPKSACYFCPFTHHQEWERRKQLEPELFAKAVEIDRKIRDLPTFGKSKEPCFISSSGYPLEEIINDQGILPLGVDFGFGAECQGHCGV